MKLGRPAALDSWLAFAALALYGTLRWDTMLEPSEQGRVFIALGMAVVCAVIVRLLPGGRLQYWTFGALVLVGLVAVLTVAGFPLHWLVDLRISRLWRALWRGIDALPGVLVPLHSADVATTEVMVLGGAALLLAAGLAFGSVRAHPGTGQLALVALPLLVLAVVPSAVVSPRVEIVHGLITFLLVVGLVFSPRLAPGRLGGLVAVLACVVLVAAIVVGGVVGEQPWLDVSKGHSATVGVETFDWAQTYNAQEWPASGATVFTVSAQRPGYWKAEDLDTFNGTRWTQGTGAITEVSDTAGISRATQAAYTETLHVHIEQLRSSDVIAAGEAGAPDVNGTVPGNDVGTWKTFITLVPGVNYSVPVYDPDPTAAQLAAAGAAYPAALAAFRTTGTLPAVYAPVEALAQRLGANVTTPYQYVEAVLRYLRHGYVYTLDPPSGGTDPLISFLMNTKRGYCQQFAGALALLLRMHGIPARVAVGFSTGTRLGDSDTYAVSDSDAHAWVEMWFPGYGWVTFDPTPGTATAGGAQTSGVASAGSQSLTTAATDTQAAPQPSSIRQAHRGGGQGDAGAGHHGTAADTGGGGGSDTVLVIALTVLGIALTGGLAVVVGRKLLRRPSLEDLTAELERGFARSGRPIGPDVTLAALERQVRDSPAAAAYIGAIQAGRYGGGDRLPSPRDRAALRQWLAGELGAGGYLRAYWALPPRHGPHAAARAKPDS